MAEERDSGLLHDLGTLYRAGAVGGLTDGQLLAMFRAGDDRAAAEAAFSALLMRHGPMVLGVCRRALHDPNDAADAFQATFLVLVRKARSVRVDDSLGRWLYGVSRRVATRARNDRLRRAAKEANAPEPSTLGFDPEHAERLSALDEEIQRLPAAYRDAVVLCDLEGLPHAAAAARLGCAVGTVESRLSRGRRKLRNRLERRGLAPAIAGLAPTAVPDALARSTLTAAASRVATSAAVVPLVEGVLAEMARTKLKLSLAALAVTASFGLGAAALAARDDDDPPPPAPPVVHEASPDAIVLQPPRRVRPGDMLTVEVLEALPGRPISGERLVRPDGTISLGFYGDLKVTGMTRDEIKVALIERLARILPDDVLGLEVSVPNEADRKTVKVPPLESNRVFVDESPTYEYGERNWPAELGATRIKPGDRLLVEVLEALPGRPISGERLVRPDGTVSLGFYGDPNVAGLTEREAKIKVVELLAKQIPVESLGLVVVDPKTDEMRRVEPADTDRVFVDASVNLVRDQLRSGNSPVERKLDRILEALGKPSRVDSYPEGLREEEVLKRRKEQAESQAARDRRVEQIETKLDRLIQAVEALKPAAK